MKGMHLTALLATPLLILFYGCQPDTPASSSGQASVASAPAASQVAPAAQAVDAKQEPKPAGAAQTAAKERELAQKSGCFACHMVEKKLVGPAWNVVSEKYRGQKDAEAKLISKVSKGGSGTWGSVPMPPNSPKVAETDIKTLVRFILSLR